MREVDMTATSGDGPPPVGTSPRPRSPTPSRPYLCHAAGFTGRHETAAAHPQGWSDGGAGGVAHVRETPGLDDLPRPPGPRPGDHHRPGRSFLPMGRKTV